MEFASYIALIPLLPLLGFLLLGFFGRRYIGNASGHISTLLIGGSAVLSLYTAWKYFYEIGPVNGAYAAIEPIKYNWLTFNETLSIDMGILLDPLSVMMLVVVTFISLMVHVFSLGYMKGEERYATYYAYLSLFTFSMLGLVLSTNIFQIYMFWELVGVSSFLLIGYYFTKPSAVAASKKAFIVTRFADLGFLIGILTLGIGAETLDFGQIIERLSGENASPELLRMTAASFLGVSSVTWALTLIFIGGAGKSAMFPLHIWLPDAMEGPTPVSALIHAATMVVAGVYLVARMFPVYANVPVALDIVTWVGVISAVIAAIIACTQTDIKRVLAYSTMSQIGYMMFALGVSGVGENSTGFTGSLFHLFTHAFFKSLLFLGAGAVIHMVHSNDMNDMGGLKKYMPVTHITFLIACLAIAGVPPFSGFFSKEEILLASWNANKVVYLLALITSGVTAFYMFRLYFSIFFRKEHHHSDSHHGEGTLSMKLPLIILGILTVITGFLPFAGWVTADGIPREIHLHPVFSIAPILVALTGIGIAYRFYFRESEQPDKISAALGGLYKSAYRKFYIDELYLFVTHKILFNLIGRPAAWADKHLVDRSMKMIGYMTLLTSELTRGIQSGRVQNYAIYLIAGIMCLAIYMLYIYR
jgi:NADH-quinone oxidoreductase subunit L